jgi:hypothetical protein
MSALPPKADMCSAARDVRFGPIADIGNIGRYEKNGPKSGSRTTGRGAQSKCQLRGTGLGTLQVRVILFGRIETTSGKNRAADTSGALRSFDCRQDSWSREGRDIWARRGRSTRLDETLLGRVDFHPWIDAQYMGQPGHVMEGWDDLKISPRLSPL